MNLTVRTLDQKTFSIEVEPTTKVAQIKTMLQEQKGYPVENQKIIFSGKILADETTVEECQFEEKSFIVVMVSKPKKATPSTSQPAPAEAPKAEPEPVSTEAPTQSEPQTSASATEAPATTQESFDHTGMAIGSEYESSILNLMELGFEREQVVKAMRASFNNPDRAADYLFNGIPSGLDEHEAQADESQADMDESQPEGDNLAAETQHSDPNSSADMSNLFLAAQERANANAPNQAEAMARLAELRNSPQFQQFRAAIQQNPSLLQPLLAQIGRSNPEFLSLINSNQSAFLDLLSGGDIDGQDYGDEDGQQYIQVTPEEKEAIDRLESLGFERSIVIQAYFACDKNEELTANYLFEHGHEE